MSLNIYDWLETFLEDYCLHLTGFWIICEEKNNKCCPGMTLIADNGMPGC